MYTNKKTIANSPSEEALSELRAAALSLQVIADRAFALAAATELEGPRRNIEHVGIRAVDLITAISGLRNGDRPCATFPGLQPFATHRERALPRIISKSRRSQSRYFHFYLVYDTHRHIFEPICHY